MKRRRVALLIVPCVILMVGLAASYGYYVRHHVTAEEKSSAFAAIYGIDGLRPEDLSESEYRRREQRALELIGKAHAKAVTVKDKVIADELDTAFTFAQAARNSLSNSSQMDLQSTKMIAAGMDGSLMAGAAENERSSSSSAREASALMREVVMKDLE